MSGGGTRGRIVRAADDLFRRQGYARTSFAHIAGEVSLSRGNFYHHFKSKDAILQAVIEQRLADARAMLARWEAASDDPAERIRSFIRILEDNGEAIMRHGCPVGALAAETARLDHGCRDDARGLFDLFRGWLAAEFARMGRAEDADALALRLLARSQGAAALAHVYGDEAFVRREIEDICAWLEAQAQAAAA